MPLIQNKFSTVYVMGYQIMLYTYHWYHIFWREIISFPLDLFQQTDTSCRWTSLEKCHHFHQSQKSWKHAQQRKPKGVWEVLSFRKSESYYINMRLNIQTCKYIICIHFLMALASWILSASTFLYWEVDFVEKHFPSS